MSTVTKFFEQILTRFKKKSKTVTPLYPGNEYESWLGI